MCESRVGGGGKKITVIGFAEKWRGGENKNFFWPSSGEENDNIFFRPRSGRGKRSKQWKRENEGMV